jgi:uncharacterized repeat protein (TIGR03803 family)
VKRSLHLALALVVGVLLAPTVYAQPSNPAITQLFGFACDSTGKTCPDGQQPNSLIQSADGNFYGTTPLGGTGNQARGTVFKITPSGQLSTVYTFVADQKGNYPNGQGPTSLVEGNDGFLYGTAGSGGANNQGVVFKLSPAGDIQVLHSFCSLTNCADGNEPLTLVLANDGNFYGGTAYSSQGTLFRITPAGAYTLLHTFNKAVDGPQCIGMTLASDGNIYGTTLGAVDLFTVLFRLTPSGQYATLHTFRYSDFPTSGPVQGSDGKLYGISRRGVFVSSLAGVGFEELPISHTTFRDSLHYVTQASDLNLWSILFKDSAGLGTLATITRRGSLLRTIPFDGANGDEPDAPVLQSSDGTLLGVTFGGGSVGQGQVASGVVFSLDAALAPPKPLFVSFNPSRGKVGSKILIHGSHFVGTTAVTFNGVSATFQVLNTGNILATVPQGASTGLIAVTNAGGTTPSKKSFTVQ